MDASVATDTAVSNNNESDIEPQHKENSYYSNESH